MTLIIAVHSFRGGTGKSNITANVGSVLAQSGLRVGIIDTDIQSPGIHVLFGFSDEQHPPHTLNEFLNGQASIAEVATDVSDQLTSCSGALYLVASSPAAKDISSVLRHGYDVERLNDALISLGQALALDVVLIDTHPGLNEETLLTSSICDVLIVILRPDKQDYQGTAVTLDVAERLGVPRRLLVVNKVYANLPLATAKHKVQEGYGQPVIAALPLSEQVAANASSTIFTDAFPQHVWSQGIREIADQLSMEVRTSS